MNLWQRLLHWIRQPAPWWGLVLVLLILGSLFLILKRNTTNSRTIFVYGVGTRDFTSDLVVWSGSYSARAMDLKDAYGILDGNRQKVLAYLTGKGVPPKDVVFSAIEIKKEWNQVRDAKGNTMNTFAGFQLMQRVTVESAEIDKVDALSRQVTELINQGFEFTSDSPSFFYSKLSDLKLEIIAQAAEDARRRADAIARKSGGSLGGLKMASADVFQITAKNATDSFTAGGVFDTTSKVKTVTLMIRAQYGVR